MNRILSKSIHYAIDCKFAKHDHFLRGAQVQFRSKQEQNNKHKCRMRHNLRIVLGF